MDALDFALSITFRHPELPLGTPSIGDGRLSGAQRTQRASILWSST